MTMTEDLAFTHRFEPARDATLPPLLLLHGTGGDENDLLPLGQAVAPGAALLSPRGQVLENGMPRFFRRMAEGVFDEDDLRRRANDLADFIIAARQQYNLPAPVALGFSNGANIAAAVLLLRPDVLSGAVLLRAMPPLRQPPAVTLGGKPVLMLSGVADPIIPVASSQLLAEQLRAGGATVTQKELPAGHGLTQMDVALSKGWLAGLA
jgi:phospholipase/carboxylesterase